MDEEGHRWRTPYAREHDLRMQNRVRVHDLFEIDSRQPTRSGRYADERPANIKSSLDNQQLAGWRNPKPSAVAVHVIRKEGPNWILIVGGALFTALGVMIVKKQKPSVPRSKMVEKSLLTRGKDKVHQSGLAFRRESTGSRTSELSADSPYSGDPCMMANTEPRHSLSEESRVGRDWGDEECSPPSPPATYYAQFAEGSNQSTSSPTHIVITPTSPPGSYRGADTSATECNDSTALSPLAQVSFSSRRDMVHRLRQQLKSRDEMILDMQAQISEQERTICVHQTRCRDLESWLAEANNTLVESNLEIQRLRRAVTEYLAGQLPSSGDLSNRRDFTYEMQQQDDAFLLREAQRLAEELQAREREKQELERLANLSMKEHELVVQRVEVLEVQLEEARNADFGKDLLLEAYEVEHENLEDQMDNLKRLIETKTPEKDAIPSMIGRNSMSGGVGILMPDQEHQGNRDEQSSMKAEDFRARARNLMRSYSLVEKKGEQLPREASNSNGRLKPDESSSNGDMSDESEAEETNSVLSEKSVTKLKQEVEQLSVILGEHYEMISEKRLETSRLVDEFQRHKALISDIQKRVDEDGEVTLDLGEQDCKSHSPYIPFPTHSTSAAQAQELSHKLEEIAQRQRVEEEIADLSRHQVKIAELKQRVEKLLTRCKSIQDSKGKADTETRERAMRMAATGSELAKQLDHQEEQARRTSREVQRLSASFELSSPYVPRSKKEELRKMLQDCSSGSSSPPQESGPPEPINMSHVVSPHQSRFTTGNSKERGDNLFEREISVSSSEPATATQPATTTTTAQVEGVSLQLGEQYVYQPGLSGPSIRNFRRRSPIRSGLAKEQSAGSRKKSMARGVKNNDERRERIELGRSESCTEVDKASQPCGGFTPDSPDRTVSAKRHNSALEPTGAFGEWSNDHLHGCDTPKSSSLAGSRRESLGSITDSSTTRIGRSPVAGPTGTLATSVGNAKSSFGRFLFDMEEKDQVYAMNRDEGIENDIPVKDTIPPAALSPCTEMIAKLNLKKEVSSSSSLSSGGSSVGRNISGLSTDMLNAIRGSPVHDGRDKNPESTASESSVSIESSLDALLSNTLDDLVLVCSASTTPADTPKSSSLMSSKVDPFFSTVI